MEECKNAFNGSILSDMEIVELYWQREENAIKATNLKYGKYLMKIAINIVHDICDSEECLNDTYLGAWNSIPPSRPAALQAFLGVIMRRVAINKYKSNMREKRVVSEMTKSFSELEDIITDKYSMDDEIFAKELGMMISDFVRSLNEREKYIFIARYYFAYPIDVIAEKLSVSRSTVNKEIAFIKRGLKQKLESEGYFI